MCAFSLLSLVECILRPTQWQDAPTDERWLVQVTQLLHAVPTANACVKRTLPLANSPVLSRGGALLVECGDAPVDTFTQALSVKGCSRDDRFKTSALDCIVRYDIWARAGLCVVLCLDQAHETHMHCLHGANWIKRCDALSWHAVRAIWISISCVRSNNCMARHLCISQSAPSVSVARMHRRSVPSAITLCDQGTRTSSAQVSQALCVCGRALLVVVVYGIPPSRI